MKVYVLVIFASLFLWLESCSPLKSNLGGSGQFLPAFPLLQSGIVHKYYLHFDGIDSQEPASTIEYRSYTITATREVLQQHYDPAFQQTRSRLFALEENKLFLRSEQQYFKNDTIRYDITQPVFLFLGQESPSFQKTNGATTWTRTQTSTRDTLLPEGKALIVDGVLVTQKSVDGDTLQTESAFREVYVAGMGLFEATLVSAEGTTTIELVEQMPMHQFMELANHDIKRVGFIDPSDGILPGGNFKLCDSPDDIVDYYNGDPDAGFKGGKYALWKELQPQIDTTLLAEESGYLTIRFVINCTGKTGWFVTEMADLDYNEKVFPPALVQHLGQLLADLDAFQPTIVRGRARDAYAYLTFKLDHGSIIDLLP
ncbi:MAG: hypothetical protein DHS20C18_04870 [Saprospiraceae bacterium]|nr:MAG: hypothetical protein DHS20C18_04870 [Saprospiraceae bacterium]